MAGNAPHPSRRTFLSGAAAVAAGLGLAGCGNSGGGSGDSGALTFWDMVWGTGADYTAAAREIVGEYRPRDGHSKVEYQSIPWANWYQTFTSAVASQSGPAISTGAAFQPFFFMDQGAVAPADEVVSALAKKGNTTFLPNLLESMKTDNGYVGIPWSLDLRVLWYRKSMLEDAGVDPPTDWDSYLQAGQALRKKGKIGFGMAAGSTTTDAQHSIFALMINNGGGMFTEDGQPDCITDRNIETLDFVNELVAKRVIDPASASYSSDNLDSDWHSGKIAMGFGQTGHDMTFPETERADVVMASPIASTSGETGTIYYLNSIMMYTNTPSQESSDAFVVWYMDQIENYWTQRVAIDLPVTRELTEIDVVKENPKLVKAIDEWQPIGKTLAARATTPFGALNAADGGEAAAKFVQRIVQGDMSSRETLEELQTGLERLAR